MRLDESNRMELAYWQARRGRAAREHVQRIEAQIGEAMDTILSERAAINRALERLPKRCQVLLRARYMQGMSGEAMARKYHMSIRAVYYHLHEAIDKLDFGDDAAAIK